jgi:hypothetical protein
MRSLINRIENLKQNKVKKLVNTRIKEILMQREALKFKMK